MGEGEGSMVKRERESEHVAKGGLKLLIDGIKQASGVISQEKNWRLIENSHGT